TAATPKRSWTMSLLHNRGCQVSIAVAAMLVVGVMVGIPLLLNNFYKSSSPTLTSNSNSSTGPRPTPGVTPGTASKLLLTYNLLVSKTLMDPPVATSPRTPLLTE